MVYIYIYIYILYDDDGTMRINGVDLFGLTILDYSLV